MALNKLVIGERGEQTSYHKISAVTQNYNKFSSTLDIRVGHYRDDSYRIKEKEDLFTPLEFNLYTETFSLLIGTDLDFSREHLYARLKAEVPMFLDAVDC